MLAARCTLYDAADVSTEQGLDQSSSFKQLKDIHMHCDKVDELGLLVCRICCGTFLDMLRGVSATSSVLNSP
jgi:hypothetical protein